MHNMRGGEGRGGGSNITTSSTQLRERNGVNCPSSNRIRAHIDYWRAWYQSKGKMI